MRDILFRGKAVESGEWHFGMFCAENYRADFPCIIPHYEDKTVDLGDWEVDPSTVGQFTGLLDKNGTKIFEGDIVESHYDDMYPENATFEEVVFRGGAWRLAQNGYDDSDPLCEDDISGYGVVVGNIYDHPELLKGGAE